MLDDDRRLTSLVENRVDCCEKEVGYDVNTSFERDFCLVSCRCACHYDSRANRSVF